MPDSEADMLAYLQLAALSTEKQQTLGRDRFLILAGAAACRAGYLDIANRCREIVLVTNPRHLIRKYASFAAALRSPDFEPLLKQLSRLCPPEQAEHLLQSQQPESACTEFSSVEDRANSLLTRIADGD